MPLKSVMGTEDLAMNQHVPEIDDCCAKEMYAFFGFAAYNAQLLEHSVLNLAIMLRFPQPDSDTNKLEKIHEELYNTLSKKTFGNLLNATKNLIKISDENMEILFDALETRNYLIHEFFRENDDNHLSEKGRREMKKELQNIITKFKKADLILEGIYLPLWGKYGITEEFLQKYQEELREKAKIRDETA